MPILVIGVIMPKVIFRTKWNSLKGRKRKVCKASLAKQFIFFLWNLFCCSRLVLAKQVFVEFQLICSEGEVILLQNVS